MKYQHGPRPGDCSPANLYRMETLRPQEQLKEETLDPEDWPEFRQFANNVLDAAVN